jgi:hypothetical protein
VDAESTGGGSPVIDAPARLPERDHAWWTSILLVLTVVSMVASTVAVWARATVLDTDRFMEVVAPALTDPSLAAALRDVVADEVLVALDLDARVAESLGTLDTFLAEAVLDAAEADPAVRERLSRLGRPTLAALSPGIAAALEARVVEVVDRLVASEAVTARLPGLVRQAHEGGVALVRGDLARLPDVEIRGGEVRMDLLPLIAQALEQVLAELRDLLPDVTVPRLLDGTADAGRELLAGSLQRRLPADFGQLTLMTGSDLAALQSAVRRVDRLVGALVLLTVVLLGVTLVTARRRRRTVVQLAAGLTLGIGIAALLARQLERVVLEAITHPDGDLAAGLLLGELTSSLRSVALLVAVAAVTTGVVAHVLGQPSWLASVRERPPGVVATEGRRRDDTMGPTPPRPPATIGPTNERDR